MQGFGRAIYTRCSVGVNFNAAVSLQEGQQIFATSGNAGLTKETITLLEKSLREDVYKAGYRPYFGEVCRFMAYGDIAALFFYCWLGKNETGGKEFGLTKVLFGAYDRHPMEYYNPTFFNSAHFFLYYPDAHGKEIHAYKQLLTFNNANIPPAFPIIPKDTLFEFTHFFPALSFKQAGMYVMQSEHVAERVRAAVCHLVTQFTRPESQRQGIVITGSRDQIQYWIAAITYAFSAQDAQKISFSLALPPYNFPYNFSTDMLIGWDENDPDLKKIKSLPSNLVFLNHLPSADDHAYYAAIVQYDAIHHAFVFDYMQKHTGDINHYPEYYLAYLAENRDKSAYAAEAETRRIRMETAQKAEEERKKQAEAVAKKNEEERKKRAEAAALRKAAEDRRSRAAALQKAEEEQRKQAEADAKKNGEERKKRAEAATLQKAETERKIWENRPQKGIERQVQNKQDFRHDKIAASVGGMASNAAPVFTGIRLAPNVVYYGCINNGIPHGWGAKIWDDGSWCIGEWAQDKHTLGAVFIPPNRLTMVGSDIITHSDKVRWTVWGDGRFYIGEYTNDKMHGWGLMCFPLHDWGFNWYLGEWASGQFHGRGIYWYRNGIFNVWKWANGVFLEQINISL